MKAALLRLALLPVAASLLQACSTPAPAPLAMQPLLRIDGAAAGQTAAALRLGQAKLARGDYAQAETDLLRVLEREPKNIEARSALAAVAALQGRLEESADLFRALADEQPHSAQAYNNLGYIHALQGQRVAAAQAYRQALAIDPQHARAANNLRLLEPVTASAPLETPRPAGRNRVELVQVRPGIYQLGTRAEAISAAPVAAAAPVPMPVPMPVPAPAPASVRPASSAPLVIANGNRVTGMAARMAQMLERRGIPVASLANQRGYAQRRTVIIYPEGRVAQAEALKNAMAGNADLEPARKGGTSSLRLILGSDMLARIGRIERDSREELASVSN